MTLLNAWRDLWPDIRITKPEPTGLGVLDEAAFKTIEVDKLFDSINHAQTIIGQAVLYRSLAKPLHDLAQIQAKQRAVQEIQQDPDLQASLQRLVDQAQRDELSFYQLLFAKFLGSTGTARDDREIEGYGYVQYRRGVRFIVDFVAGTESIASPKSSYLQAIFAQVQAFKQTRAHALMQGPVYITEKAIQSRLDRSALTPAIIFKPHIFKPLLLALLVGAGIAAKYWLPAGMLGFSDVGFSAAAIFFIPLLLIYFPIIGGFDRDSCIKPLRDEYRESADVGAVVDALGQIDELLALVAYANTAAQPLVMPELYMAQHHQIALKNAKNPVLSKADSEYVGNDFVLDQQRLVMITGPNSGGKTAFCKTITQIQLLAQIGSYVPAAHARLTVADRVFYQAPEISQLDDGEGRFGTELKRTKAIFLACTANSLVVLDELSEGTTFEEKMETSANVLDGFYQKGNSTVLITHNHQLVDHFVAQKIAMDLQVEFVDEEPTHKLIPGISRVSHAHRVAKKIGFSKEDIAGYLAGD